MMLSGLTSTSGTVKMLQGNGTGVEEFGQKMPAAKKQSSNLHTVLMRKTEGNHRQPTRLIVERDTDMIKQASFEHYSLKVLGADTK